MGESIAYSTPRTSTRETTPFLEKNILCAWNEFKISRLSYSHTTQKNQRNASKIDSTHQSNGSLETNSPKIEKVRKKSDSHSPNRELAARLAQRKCQIRRGAQQGTHPIRWRQEKFHGWTGEGALVGCTERKRLETKRDQPLRTSRDAWASPRLEIKCWEVYSRTNKKER